MLTIATVNVNGIRAAMRRGMGAWLTEQNPDILCLQEVRATDAVLKGLLEEALGGGWHIAHSEPTDTGSKGRAGVAIATRMPVQEQRHLLEPRFDGAGRWVELDVETPAGPVTIISVYVHTGEADTPKQDDKYAFLDAITRRMEHLADSGHMALICGDFNIAHRNEDIKNWKANTKKAGFLPAERSYIDRWLTELGWVDVIRSLRPDDEGPYSWWSWRGTAFDRDIGWRIDLQFATPKLGRLAVAGHIDRAPTYAERWSDHAPVIAHYEAEAFD